MRQYKILLVDDSRNMLRSLKRSLRQEDFSIYTAESSKEALAVLKKEPIDLIISDENMPGGSGTELLEIARSLYPDTIRIMLTGMTDIEVAKRAINNGEIYRFFTKPWDQFELVLSVRYALRQKQIEEENTNLKSMVNDQREMLRQLEKKYPGIATKNTANSGAIILDGEE